MNSLDLTVIAEPADPNIAVLARRGHDTVVACVPAAAVLELGPFRKRLEEAILGNADRPTKTELQAFGRRLFSTLAQDRLRSLLDGLSTDPISFALLSNRQDIQMLPWEFISEPNRPFGPSLERSIVRLVPTLGVPPYVPAPRPNPVRILFVSADPIDQGPVNWADVKESIQRAFGAEIPDRFEFDPIEAATPKILTKHLDDHPPYDIVHFSCHGRVVNGEGEILLLDLKTKRSAPLTSTQLSNLLRQRGVRLVVLSACQTADGNFASEFSVMADALVRGGVPAVVANQFPIHNNTVATFVGPLYDELLKSGDIDLAVARGRVMLATALQTPDAILEWGIPVLYRHIAASQVFAL